jgi:NAD(P)-dependent dehydrogenase (short-subunit alcohol dehydrogenase family)
VLVTGATGGVGQYAVQLAALAGANVTALVRNVGKSRDQLRSLGAATVVDAVEGQFDTVVDAVRGTTFTAAIEHIAPRAWSSTLQPIAQTRSSPSERRAPKADDLWESGAAPPRPRAGSLHGASTSSSTDA